MAQQLVTGSCHCGKVRIEADLGELFEYRIKEPVTLYGLTPHLHLRGKSMRYTLTWPDGREEVLLDVPRYDFNWQVYYELEGPKQIPEGSKITVVTYFDNSVKNKYNPAPEKEVWCASPSIPAICGKRERISKNGSSSRRGTKKAGA